MALLWHKENGAWADRTDALSFKNAGSWGKKPTWYKHDGQWQLLGNSQKVIEWKLEDLLALSTKEDFSSYVTTSFADYGLMINNIGQASKVSSSALYGFQCHYGDRDGSTDKDPVLFATNPMPLPKRIVCTLTFQDTSVSYINHMGVSFIQGDKGSLGVIRPRVLSVMDSVAGSWQSGYVGFFINNEGTMKKQISAAGTYTYIFDVTLPNDVPACKLDTSQEYSLYWINTSRVKAGSSYYESGPIYVSYLKLEY